VGTRREVGDGTMRNYLVTCYTCWQRFYLFEGWAENFRVEDDTIIAMCPYCKSQFVLWNPARSLRKWRKLILVSTAPNKENVSLEET